MSDDHLFREVDEEVRQERAQQYWKRYGGYAVGAVAAIIVAVVAYVVWQDFRESAREEAASRFFAALNLTESDTLAARERLDAVANDAGAGYRLLARMRAAALAAEAGDAAAAVAIYDTIAADTRIEPLYRDLARLLAASSGMAILSLPEVEQRIGPLTAADNAWRFTAREFLAVASLAAGENARARELLEQLSEDSATPANTRRRAFELLATLEG